MKRKTHKEQQFFLQKKLYCISGTFFHTHVLQSNSCKNNHFHRPSFFSLMKPSTIFPFYTIGKSKPSLTHESYCVHFLLLFLSFQFCYLTCFHSCGELLHCFSIFFLCDFLQSLYARIDHDFSPISLMTKQHTHDLLFFHQQKVGNLHQFDFFCSYAKSFDCTKYQYRLVKYITTC